MSVLPDHEIEKRCDPTRWKNPLITPFAKRNLQPSSVDLSLARDFIAPIYTANADSIDLLDIESSGIKYEKVESDTFDLLPLHFVLGSTVEKVQLPPGLVAHVDGKSSLGRLGLTIHSTAGYIDAGFCGTITLEMFNANPRPIRLRAGLPICQISFSELSLPAKKPYGHEDLDSKYQDQIGTTPSRYAG